ncbi:hypothetical protein OAF75_00840 [Verrucomicrobiales bacterium]|nr:hypothetical protein [Verrucomicrobiales bacterium]MDB4720701.1 hypothetical protein [Verrucomicrobiales bacterium]MDB4737359.1 hypothetical protein [Verrucomicrobiales bacterium]NCG26493.1 hypothetical protein [Verrucomicrobiales bacterium]|tara:strand:+ start:3898 stop:4728 length:831 start_codon:yes stop_codon:yes gene_type:complete
MKLLKLWNSFLISLVIFLSDSIANESTVTAVFQNDANYKGTDDTFVRKGSNFSGGMSNFGRCPTLEINEQTRLGLIRFDVSSLFKKYIKIHSVTLRLFSKNAPKSGGISAHRLNIANSAWREGGNCGGTVIGGNRHEVTWFHLADYGGFPSPPPSWASRTAGPATSGVDYDEKALGLTNNKSSKENSKFDIVFNGDLNGLINDWALAAPIAELRDRGGNPSWTADWNWAQPAAETANEGILLKGIDGTVHVFHSSEAENPELRPQLIVTYQPRTKG